MRSRAAGIIIALASIAVTLAGPLSAQTLFSARGLGYPIEPVDARSRGLGGVTLGFAESRISWDSPAAAVGLGAPGLLIGYQYDQADATLPGATTDLSTARFPLILGAFPIGERFSIIAGYGAYVDQNWRVVRPDSLVIGSDSLAISDIVSSDGGVARIRAGAGYQLIPSLAIGLALDFYTGSVERVEGRLFPGLTTPVCCRATWNYSGIGYTASAHWAPTAATGVGLSVGYGGTLDGEVQSGESSDVSYDLPLSLKAGASARIAQPLVVALGGSWTGWSSLDETLADAGGAHDAWSANAGLEYDGILIGERRFPLRLGARTAALPFQWGQSTATRWADERAVTFGLGALFAGGAVNSDLAVELGDRKSGDAALDESFWRFSFSVRVLGR